MGHPTVKLETSFVDLNTLNLDPDPGFLPNLDLDPDPGPGPDPDSGNQSCL